MWVTAAVGYLIFFLGLCLLSWRWGIKKNGVIGLSTIDSYIVINSIGFGLGRALDSTGLALVWFSNATWAQLSSDIPYVCGMISVWIYLCSLVRMTPAYTSDTIWLPTPSLLRIIRYAYILTSATTIIPVGIFSGLARDAGDFDRESLLTCILYLLYSFFCGVLSAGFAFFGRQMVRVAEASAADLKASSRSRIQTSTAGSMGCKGTGTLSGGTTRSGDSRMRKAIGKMKLFNWTFTCIFLWFAAVLMVFSFRADTLFATTWWSRIQSIGTNVMTVILVLIGYCGLIWGEFHSPDDDEMNENLSGAGSKTVPV
ncbi:hypothetical protein SpCBS45565_g08156 [Spizellomyces sp. 'palustris']|nr:hypothetical protein SpCBS45565_g08156 [Spizellomyces sp. 'palustris']